MKTVRGHGQRAARGRAFAGCQQVGLLKIGEHAPAGGSVALARLAQLERSRRSVEEFGADMLLQEGDGAANRGRRAAELAPAPARLPSSSAATKTFMASRRSTSSRSLILPAGGVMVAQS